MMRICVTWDLLLVLLNPPQDFTSCRAGARPGHPISDTALPFARPGNPHILTSDCLPIGGAAMKLPRRRFLQLAAGAAALPAVSRLASAQAYPSKPITIVVP